MLCTRAAAFLVGSVVLPRLQYKAAATKAAEAYASRQRALEAAAAAGTDASAADGGCSSSSSSAAAAKDPTLATVAKAVAEGGAVGAASAAPAAAAADPALIHGAESGEGMHGVRADALLRAVDYQHGFDDDVAQVVPSPPSLAPPCPHPLTPLPLTPHPSSPGHARTSW